MIVVAWAEKAICDFHKGKASLIYAGTYSRSSICPFFYFIICPTMCWSHLTIGRKSCCLLPFYSTEKVASYSAPPKVHVRPSHGSSSIPGGYFMSPLCTLNHGEDIFMAVGCGKSIFGAFFQQSRYLPPSPLQPRNERPPPLNNNDWAGQKASLSDHKLQYTCSTYRRMEVRRFANLVKFLSPKHVFRHALIFTTIKADF